MVGEPLTSVVYQKHCGKHDLTNIITTIMIRAISLIIRNQTEISRETIIKIIEASQIAISLEMVTNIIEASQTETSRETIIKIIEASQTEISREMVTNIIEVSQIAKSLEMGVMDTVTAIATKIEIIIITKINHLTG